jgi:hypothetical protein
VPSLLIPIFYELVDCAGLPTPVVWPGVFGWFQILCSLRSREDVVNVEVVEA